jgi:Uma2 family endonuclease
VAGGCQLIPNTYPVKSPTWESGYQPDIIVLDEEALEVEPLWQKASTISLANSVKLAVEIVSTNWRDDYLLKAGDYEAIGIPEYWIVDYLGLGGRRFIGNPKQPTLSIYQLIEGEYQVKQFREKDRIESLAFPELNLTAEQVLRGGKSQRSPQS